MGIFVRRRVFACAAAQRRFVGVSNCIKTLACHFEKSVADRFATHGPQRLLPYRLRVGESDEEPVLRRTGQCDT